MVEIREVAETPRRFERVGAHTHIRGLGLTEDLQARPVGDGMVAQQRAREAAGLVVEMIKEGKLSGKTMILAGPPGTGKTAIAVAISRELGKDLPFIQLSGSEVYSSERKKTEVLMEEMRKAIGVEVHEMRQVYEGDIVDLDIQTSSHPYNPYQEVPEKVRVTLKTRDEERTIEAGSSIAEQLSQQGIREGHVIQIDADSGRLSDQGVSTESSVAGTLDVDAQQKVPLPEGEVMKEKEFVYTLTLADLDEINARRRGGGVFSMFMGGGDTKEIDPEIRTAVDEQVKEWVDQGKAYIHPGVLFLDDSHLLDLEAFSFLGRALESELVPIIILATNRGVTKIRGTDVESLLGFPLDLIDRSVIISTDTYDQSAIKEILKIRAEQEEISLDDSALSRLTEIGAETSLRYSVQLLSLAAQNAKGRDGEEVGGEDVDRVASLFKSAEEAASYLRKYEEELLKH